MAESTKARTDSAEEREAWLEEDHFDASHARHFAAPSRKRRMATLIARAPVDLPRRLAKGTVARLPALTITIAAGLLLVVSFPPFGWWFTAVAAFALLGWVLVRESTTAAGGFGYGFLFGLAFYVPLLPWTSELVGAMPWLALSVVCALYPALFGLAARLIRRFPGWPLLFAAAWVAQEWIKSSVPLGGFPWGVVAFGQTDGPMLAIVRVGGAPLLSFAVALIGFGVTALVLELTAWWRRDTAAIREFGHRARTPPRVLLPAGCICLVLFGTAAIWPLVRASGTGAGTEPTINVAVVQGNVPRLGLDFNAQRRAVLDYHVAETKRLADDVAAGRVPQPQFVVWPENSSDIDPIRNPDAAEQISAAAAAIHAPILVGAVLQGPGYGPDNPASTNTVIVWNADGGPGERHDKQIVQPFGEYLPYREFFRHFSPYADRAGYFVPVDGDGVVTAAGVPIGVTTCWEVIFDRAARESVRNGAQVLAVPTNNALFGDAMSEQQLAFAKVRAVEHDRYALVVGTTGISAVITPDGHEIGRTAFFEPAYLVKTIHLKTQLTPATRWGPIIQWIFVGVAGAALLTAVLQNGLLFVRRRRRSAIPGGDEGAT